jgi:hypothetical protein
MASEPKERALDIFEALDRINHNDFGFYASLTEEQQKSFQPYVAMKWMQGTSKKKQLVRLNNRVNPYVFSLGNNHKQLMFMLMCACTDGRAQRYTWSKGGGRKAAKSHSVAVICELYKYTIKQAQEVLHMFTVDDILEMAQYLGKQTDELTKIKSEHKTKSK